MKTINSVKEFYEYIEQDEITLVYFYTQWCPDCFAVKPFLPKLEEEYSNIVFLSMDRDSDLELAKHLNIYGIPSFLLYQSGKELGRFVDKNRKTYVEVKSFIDTTLKG